MKMTKILALLLALCLAVGSLAGCASGQDTAVAATYDGGELPAGVYLYYLVSAYTRSVYQVENPYDDPLGQTVDGVDASEWIVSEAQTSLRRYAAVEKKFSESGLALDETVLASAENSLASFWENYGDMMQECGISRESAEKIYLNSAKSSLLQASLYGEGGEFAVAEDTIQAYYSENYRRVLVLPMPLTGVDEDETALRRELTDTYYDRAVNGEAISDLLKEEYTRRNSDKTEEEIAEDLDNLTYELLLTKTNSSYPTALVDAIFAETETGKVEKYTSDTLNAIFVVEDLMGDGSEYAQEHASLLTTITADDYTELLTQEGDAIQFAMNDAAVKRYTPKDLAKRIKSAQN